MVLVSLGWWAFRRARQFRTCRSENGASLIEYTLLIMLVAMVALVALHFLGGVVSNSLSSDVSSINNP